MRAPTAGPRARRRAGGEARAPDPERTTLDRRALLRGALGAASVTILGPVIKLGRCRLDAAIEGAPPVEVSTRAIDAVLGSPVIDMLSLLTLDWPKLTRWQSVAGAFGEDDFRVLERSGIQIFHPAVETRATDSFQAALKWVARWDSLTRSGSCFFAPVRTAAGLDAAIAERRLGVIVGFQDADHFRDVADVAMFHGLGQRLSQLTYNVRNRLGSGCLAPSDRGLSSFGAQVVEEMNRVGMAIDVSHCGEHTAREAIALSKVPVLITHSNCRKLVPEQPRCRSDELIRALGAKGGVMGITVVRPFVGPGRPSIETLLDHFDHVRSVAGVEHVGLGSDLDVTPHAERPVAAREYYSVRGLDPVARVFQIADGLARRGWTASELALVLGGNFRRALGAIWPQAPREPAEPRDPFCPAPGRRAPAEIVALKG